MTTQVEAKITEDFLEGIASQVNVPFSWWIFEAGDQRVLIDGVPVTFTIPAEYIQNNNGGYAVLDTPLVGGEVIATYRDMTIKREVVYNKDLRSETLNNQEAKVIAILQEHKRGIDRAAGYGPGVDLAAPRFPTAPEDGFGFVYNGTDGTLRKSSKNLDTLGDDVEAIAVQANIDVTALKDAAAASASSAAANVVITNADVVTTNANVVTCAASQAGAIAAKDLAESALASLHYDIKNITADYTILDSDHLQGLSVDTTAGAVTITLPLATTMAEDVQFLIVKRTGSNPVTLVATGVDTIAGAASLEINVDGLSRLIKADNVNGSWSANQAGESLSGVGLNSIQLGTNANAGYADVICIGQDTTTNKGESISIGLRANGHWNRSIAIGKDSYSAANDGISIGTNAGQTGSSGLCIGVDSGATSSNATAYGKGSLASGGNTVALGYNAQATIANDYVLGNDSNNVQVPGSLSVNGTSSGFRPNRVTTTQRDAITATEGMIVSNTTTNQIEAYNGTAWVALGGGGKILQMVSNKITSGNYDCTSTSYLDTNVTGTITPLSTTSKIIVEMHFKCIFTGGSTRTNARNRIKEGASNYIHYMTNGATYVNDQHTLFYQCEYDNSTLTAKTFTLQISRSTGNHTVRVGHDTTNNIAYVRMWEVEA